MPITTWLGKKLIPFLCNININDNNTWKEKDVWDRNYIVYTFVAT